MDIINWAEKNIFVKTNDIFTKSSCMLRIDFPSSQATENYLFSISLYDQKDYFQGNAYKANLSQAVPWESQTLNRLFNTFKKGESNDKIEISYETCKEKLIIKLSVMFAVTLKGPEYTVLQNTILTCIEPAEALRKVISTNYNQTNLIEKKLKDVSESFNILKQSYDLIQNELKSVITVKQKSEEELLKKFVSLLNAKKEKCRSLKEQLIATKLEGMEVNNTSPISSPYSTSSIGNEDLSPKSFLNKLKRSSQTKYQDVSTKTPTKRQTRRARNSTYDLASDIEFFQGESKFQEDSFLEINDNRIITDPKLIDDALNMIQVKPEIISDDEFIPFHEETIDMMANSCDEFGSSSLATPPKRFPISSCGNSPNNIEPKTTILSSSLLKESLFSPPKLNSDDSDSSLENSSHLPPINSSNVQKLNESFAVSPNKSYISLRSKLDKLKSGN